MPVRIHAAGKGNVVDGSAPPLQPSEQTASRVCSDFELNWSSGLLLNHHGPGADHRAGYKGANLDFHEITPPNLLSIARSKSARSRIQPSRSRKNRMDQIWRTLKACLAPTCLPAFQADFPAAAGSYCEIPITFLQWPKRP